MTVRPIANWLTGIVWLSAFCGFIFSALTAPYDDSRFQFVSVLIFMATVGLAVSVTLLRRAVLTIADDNWRLTVPRVLAVLIIVPLVVMALLYLTLGLSMVRERLESSRVYYELYPDRAH